MPYSSNWEHNGVYRRYSGMVSGVELIEASLDMYADSRFDEINYLIADFSQVDGFNISMEEVEKLAHFNTAAAKTNGNIKTALVINDESAKSLVSIYDIVTEANNSPWENKVFSSIDEARHWAE